MLIFALKLNYMKTSFDHVDCKHCSNRFNSVFCKTENDAVKEIDASKVCASYRKKVKLFLKKVLTQVVFIVLMQAKLKLLC